MNTNGFIIDIREAIHCSYLDSFGVSTLASATTCTFEALKHLTS